MKKLSLGIASTFLFVTIAALAANFTDDQLQFGKPGSSANKEIVFGASNKKKLKHVPGTQTLDYEGNNLSVGDGANTADKTLKLNKGANSPTLRHNFTSGDLEIENAPVLNQKGNTVSVGDGTNTNKVLKFNKGASSPEIRYNSTTGKLQFTNDTTTYKDIGSGSGGGGGTNLLQEFNSDFEAGSPPQNWTASGGTFITETADPLFGLQSGSWDSSASAQTLSSQLVTIEKGFIGKKCTADIEYRWPSGVSGDLSFQVVDQVPNILATVPLDPTTGSNTRKAFLAFDCPSVATDQLRVRLLSNVSNPALIVVDNAFVGVNKSTTNVSQASVWATSRWLPAASCNWQGNGAAVLTHFFDFPADTDCANPTVGGQAVVPGTKVPRLRVASVPPGKYMLIVKGGTFGTFSGTGTGQFALTDGTLDGGVRMFANTTSTTSPGTMIGYFEYASAQTNLEFRPIAQPTAGTWVAGIDNSETTQNETILTMELYRFPTESAEALNLETTGQSWSGYHDGTCAWARSNAAYGDFGTDASCALIERTNQAFGSVVTQAGTLPGIVFNAPSSARYWVCANATSDQAVAGNQYFLRLFDGTNTISEANFQDVSGTGQLRPTTMVCGIYNATSAGQKTITLQARSDAGATITVQGLGGNAIEWSMFRMDQAFPAPVFTEVRNKMNAGEANVKTASVGINFPGGVPTIFNQIPAGWVTSLTDNGSGLTTVNFPSYFSAAPLCVMALDSSAGSHIGKLNGGTGTTSTQVRTYDLAGTNVDISFVMTCTGK